MARRTLIAIAGLALVLHGLGMSRTLLPAQDGLKFIRVARQFGHVPWTDVVRGSDQHPLYSALIALAEPPVALVLGESPDAWRVAAQLVSVLAAVATLVPLFGFARALFGERAAILTTLVYVLLPIPGAIGRDTLSDSLSLFFFASALRLGELALRTDRRSAWIATGLVAGIGYLARPEILIVPTAVVLTGLARFFGRREIIPIGPHLARVGGLGVATLAIVGGYAFVKGEVSEKLSLRIGASLGASARGLKSAPPPMPAGLEGPAWNFAPKEESSEIRIQGAPARTALRLGQQWAEGLAWIMLPFLAWGVVRAQSLEGSHVGRQLVAVYVTLFAAVVIRHASTLGYLSGRHALTLVVATIPWVGAGIWAWASKLPERRGLTPRTSRRLAVIGLVALITVGVTSQVKAMHHSRWGHLAAGRWLRDNAKPSESVLDTRGWAMFVRGGTGYDYWHVRQAITDASLGYVVVGDDELKSESDRAATLRAMLAYAASPVAEFPDREGSKSVGVRVYRFRRPDSWEGIRR
jgi:hypothetical protein